jgi:nucleotide-binding universal stress UspA family protein
MYRRILVATGGSPWSHAALTYAIALAARMGAELRILAVLTLPTSYSADKTASSMNLVLGSIENAAQELLEEAADRALRANVPYTTHYTWGPIPTTILHTATEGACDLIVLGSRRVAGCQRRTLGRIANVVAAQAPQPVLIVKRPLVPQALHGKRILVATGGSPWSEAAVNHALTLAQNQDFEVCLMHVERDAPDIDAESRRSEGKQLLTQTEARAAAAGIAYAGVLDSGPIPYAILATASRQQCSAIIVGSRGVMGWKRPLLGHIASTVAARADLPVLIVKHFVSL